VRFGADFVDRQKTGSYTAAMKKLDLFLDDAFLVGYNPTTQICLANGHQSHVLLFCCRPDFAASDKFLKFMPGLNARR
jgi:hypothetical protein